MPPCRQIPSPLSKDVCPNNKIDKDGTITPPVLSPLKRLYNWTMRSALSPHATKILGIVSFLESCVSPIMPDIMLVPMVLAQKAKAWYYALVCTITSVLGGITGYMLGYFLFETIGEWIIQTYNLNSNFLAFHETFQKWGMWIILLKGFTPIPFKLVTIASGVAELDFIKFILASIVARGTRFSLVCGSLWYFGNDAKKLMDRYFGWIIVGFLLTLVVGFFIFKVIFV